MGRAWCASMTWPAIEKIGGYVEGFDPKTRRHGCMKEESTHTVVERPEDALGLPVLLACVRTREPEMSAVATEERPKAALSNSRPLSLCMVRTLRLKWHRTRARKDFM